ncbi:hypothetical protein PV797_14785 [Clostridiaceae bacterium M8S5]|nr:hypothetical protein PV797_14785 [Clostridiaceae bacterium M8S5]
MQDFNEKEKKQMIPPNPNALGHSPDIMPPPAPMNMTQMTPVIGPNYNIPAMPYGSQMLPQAMGYPDMNMMNTCNNKMMSMDDNNTEPPVLGDKNYLQGYLKTLIGKYIRVDFLIGSNTFLDKEGVLTNVGVDHIILREPQTDDLVIADMYSIKFVKVFE